MRLGHYNVQKQIRKKELKVTPKGKTLRTVIKQAPGKKIVKRRRNKIKKAFQKKLITYTTVLQVQQRFKTDTEIKEDLKQRFQEGGQNRPVNEDLRRPLKIEENSIKGSEDGEITASK